MSVSGYETYTRQLGLLVADVAAGRWQRVADDVTHALNGQAAATLRREVPRHHRREAGSFFTAGAVRESFEQLLRRHPAKARTGVLWDPACGAGDLLLAACDDLPLGATPSATLTLWNRLVRGNDLHEPFVAAARMRLVLAVLDRHRRAGSEGNLLERRWERAFPRILRGDGLRELELTAIGRGFGGSLLLNPPYGLAPAPKHCSWSTGRTSLAAIFTAAASDALAPGGNFFAVLPDVLRSGSRYRAWRERTADALEVSTVHLHGQFDAYTDVDVFLLAGSRRSVRHSGAASWWPQEDVAGTDQTVGDLFSVRVGSVVDNRDPHDGPLTPYLTARELPGRGETGIPTRQRRFAGRLVKPPFVALRRTSRPGQGAKGGTRGAGVLVMGDRPVAIDNHLIVASPLSGGVRSCRKLIDVLDGPQVERWLDERIRCRHLTVSVVRGMPWNSGA